jgi:hypothetical protein
MWCLQSNGKSESEILNEQITIYNRTIKYNKLMLIIYVSHNGILIVSFRKDF